MAKVGSAFDRGWFRSTLGWKEELGGAVPLRFTPEQMDIYEPTPVYRTRSLSPAGVCLDVWTDAAELTIEVDVVQYFRPYCYLDLYLQDQYVESIGAEGNELGSKSLTFRLQSSGKLKAADSPSTGMQRVTVYLPHNLELILRKAAFSPGARVEPAPPKAKNLLCLGDSITQGMDAVRPSFTYAVQLSRLLGMNLLNQGVGGYHFQADSLSARLPELGYAPNLITVAYGTNDWGRWESLEVLSDRVQTYIERLTAYYPEVPIYVITPLWRVDWLEAKAMGTFEQLTAAISDACRSYPAVRVILGTEVLPHDSLLLADNVHPKEEGFRLLAEALAKRITS